MTQRGRTREPPPIGIVYHTSMNRPDAALALAAIYAFENRREARVGSVCVAGSGLAAAIFCEVVARFYVRGDRNSNQMLPVGLAGDPVAPDPPMVEAALARMGDNGEPLYRRTIRRVADTALPETILRNGVVFNAECAMVLSAPATWLVRSLDLPGTREIYEARVRRLVIVDNAETGQDPAALERIVDEWPGPIVFCGADVGEALPFPGARLEEAFRWAGAHPVVDAYRAFQPMPYDTPGSDLAAVHYAVHPDSGLFDVSAEGSLAISASAGAVMEALIAAASAQPQDPTGRGRRGQ